MGYITLKTVSSQLKKPLVSFFGKIRQKIKGKLALHIYPHKSKIKPTQSKSKKAKTKKSI